MPIVTRNENRFRKVYGTKRTRPVIVNVPSVESPTLVFSNENEKTYTFTKKYDNIPSISATVSSPTGASVIVHVESVNTTSVTISTSANFSGNITLLIVET